MQQLSAPLPSVCLPMEIQGLRNPKGLLCYFALHGSTNLESQFNEAAKGKEECLEVEVLCHQMLA